MSWDMEQTHESLRQSMIEEAYGSDAIDNEDIDNLVEGRRCAIASSVHINSI